MNDRFLKSLVLIAMGAAAWVGCSASDAPVGGMPTAASEDGGEALGEEETDDPVDAQATKKDAGKKSDAGKDASPAKDAAPGAIDAGGGVDAAACWPFPCTSSDAGSTAKDAGTTACNTVPVAVVTPKASGGFSPAMNGGTIIDGTYALTASTRYINGTSNTTFPSMGEGLTISGGTLQLRLTSGFGGASYNYTFTKNAKTLSMTRTCPSASTETWSFDAQGTTLILYGLPPNYGTWYQTFEKI